jgi:anti-anti-sigma factor
MELSGEREGDVLVLTPEGRIDGSNSADFQSAVMERIDEGSESILLDFAGISYISSAGLRAVLILAKKLNQVNGSFALCSMQQSVQSVFEVSGFVKIIDVHPGRPEAFAAMQ